MPQNEKKDTGFVFSDTNKPYKRIFEKKFFIGDPTLLKECPRSPMSYGTLGKLWMSKSGDLSIYGLHDGVLISFG